jgi:hypothetical protein
VKSKIYLFLPAALGPGVHSASNRNEYRKHKKIMFLGSKVRSLRGADNLMSRLSGHCGILNISQAYRPSRPVTGIALLFFLSFYLGKDRKSGTRV